MSILDDIAHAIGHTVESLASDIGIPVHQLEGVVQDLEGLGFDVFSTAARFGLSPASFLSKLVSTVNNDPHQRLLHSITAPIKPLNDTTLQLSGYWQQMSDFHNETKKLIDAEMADIFQPGGPTTYSGQAADALLAAHTSYQQYFDPLITHAHIQQTRHTTLASHTTTFLNQAPGTVNGLPTPLAALGVMSFQFAGDVDPFITGLEGVIAALGEGIVIGLPEDIPILPLLIALLIILVIILVVALILDPPKTAVDQYQQQQQTTNTPQPSPVPTPNPQPDPDWPWPDPIPPWVPPHDHDCYLRVNYVKSRFPGVRADLISYLVCIEPEMTPQEVVEYFTYWTTHGMSEQDINDMLDRLRNLRLHPGYGQLSRDQIVAFIRNHYQDIPDIWSKYRRVQNIPGVDHILRDMANGNPNNYKGSRYQLDWLVDHANQVREVEAVGPNNEKEADFVLNNGTVVDVKSYNWTGVSFIDDASGADIAAQIVRYRHLHPNTPIQYYFDSSGGTVPQDIQDMLNNGTVTTELARHYVAQEFRIPLSSVTPAQILQAQQDISAAMHDITWQRWP